MDDMDEAPLPEAQAGLIRYLKGLVTALTVTMIAGLIVLIAVIVMRFNQSQPFALPESLVLPEGVTAAGITFVENRVIVVTTQGEILVLGDDMKTIKQTIKLD
ncbi:MAG: DUF6476 family protein [Maritimibacter sp.]